MIQGGRVRWKPAVDLNRVMLLALLALFGMRSMVKVCAKACARRASGTG